MPASRRIVGRSLSHTVAGFIRQSYRRYNADSVQQDVIHRILQRSAMCTVDMEFSARVYHSSTLTV